MIDNVAYPAVFTCVDNAVCIEFPDLKGCLSEADSLNEAVHWARDALSLRLYSDECDNIPFPNPSDPLALSKTLGDNQFVTLIDVDMNIAREKLGNKTVNKMVSLPQWLVTRGKNSGINFSQLLKDALIKELGLEKH